MRENDTTRELWVMGLGDRKERGALLCSYLAEADYWARTADMGELEVKRPLGIVLDLSPYSADGWGVLLKLKNDESTRDIPLLPVYLSQEGKVGGVFPVAGFFTLPIDTDYLIRKLTVLGLTEDTDTYDLQSLVVSRKGEETVAKTMSSMGFDVVNAYTGKEAVALASIQRCYIAFSAAMLSDMSALELLDRFLLYPKTRNVPLFVLIKAQLKEGERLAMSREIEHLVRKKELSKDEFITYFRRKA